MKQQYSFIFNLVKNTCIVDVKAFVVEMSVLLIKHILPLRDDRGANGTKGKGSKAHCGATPTSIAIISHVIFLYEGGLLKAWPVMLFLSSGGKPIFGEIFKV